MVKQQNPQDFLSCVKIHTSSVHTTLTWHTLVVPCTLISYIKYKSPKEIVKIVFSQNKFEFDKKTIIIVKMINFVKM